MFERILYSQCPLCETPDIVPHRDADCSRHSLYQPQLNPTMVWMECKACGHIFTDGYFDDEACEIIFSNTHENQKVGGPIEQNRQVSARMIEKVLPYADQGVWLDVGFGNGSLLFTAQEYGFRAVGTDLRERNVQVIQSLGVEAYAQDFTQLELGELCSVVSMADVLEHIPYPKKALLGAHALLESGGALLLSMPNMENVIWRLKDQTNQNPYWGEIEHYHNFSRTRLYALLRECGFEPARYGISERYTMCMEVVALKI